jgi:acetamidase/formamidase
VPFAPFCGVIGVAWDEEGSFSVIPPRAFGSNMDIK